MIITQYFTIQYESIIHFVCHVHRAIDSRPIHIISGQILVSSSVFVRFCSFMRHFKDLEVLVKINTSKFVYLSRGLCSLYQKIQYLATLWFVKYWAIVIFALRDRFKTNLYHFWSNSCIFLSFCPILLIYAAFQRSWGVG